MLSIHFFGAFIIIILGAFLCFLWIFALIDLLKSNFKDSNSKLIWTILIVFMPFIGSLLYFAIGRNQKIK